MRDNSNLVLCGDKAVLVPYRQEHVPLYHTWMVTISTPLCPPPPPPPPPGRLLIAPCMSISCWA